VAKQIIEGADGNDIGFRAQRGRAGGQTNLSCVEGKWYLFQSAAGPRGWPNSFQKTSPRLWVRFRAQRGRAGGQTNRTILCRSVNWFQSAAGPRGWPNLVKHCGTEPVGFRAQRGRAGGQTQAVQIQLVLQRSLGSFRAQRGRAGGQTRRNKAPGGERVSERSGAARVAKPTDGVGTCGAEFQSAAGPRGWPNQSTFWMDNEEGFRAQRGRAGGQTCWRRRRKGLGFTSFRAQRGRAGGQTNPPSPNWRPTMFQSAAGPRGWPNSSEASSAARGSFRAQRGRAGGQTHLPDAKGYQACFRAQRGRAGGQTDIPVGSENTISFRAQRGRAGGQTVGQSR